MFVYENLNILRRDGTVEVGRAASLPHPDILRSIVFIVRSVVTINNSRPLSEV